jgi:23S rRNA (uridine2552-2'-O)-methyltransferase
MLQNKKKRSLSSRTWLNRQVNDPYVKKARQSGYISRASFKLIEMNDKFRLIDSAKKIIDIGAAPGGWSQVLSRISVDDAIIAGIDIRDFPPIDKVKQFLGNFEDTNVQQSIADYVEYADLVLSDMAPATTGDSQTDHIRIMQMAECAYSFAASILREKGKFVVKVFQGGMEKSFLEQLKKKFDRICFFKPKSSRSMSSEIYIIAIGFKKCT